MRLATCSEMFADVPGVVHESCPQCEMSSKFAEDCRMFTVHAGSTEGKTDECPSEIEFDSALLYYLCCGIKG